MKSILIVFLLSLLASATDSPKYGWKQVGSETFSIDAMGHKYYRIPQHGRWRFDFKSEEAIYTGVATAEQYGRVSARYLTHLDFNGFACVKKSIIEAAVVCDITQPNERLAIRDKRGPVTRTVGAYATVKPLGNGQMADRASKPNKVSVTFYRWMCVENCSQ